MEIQDTRAAGVHARARRAKDCDASGAQHDEGRALPPAGAAASAVRQARY